MTPDLTEQMRASIRQQLAQIDPSVVRMAGTAVWLTHNPEVMEAIPEDCVDPQGAGEARITSRRCSCLFCGEAALIVIEARSQLRPECGRRWLDLCPACYKLMRVASPVVELISAL